VLPGLSAVGFKLDLTEMTKKWGRIVGTTALWDPWDASPSTLEITGTECIWSPPTFATGCHFSLGTVGNLQFSPDLLPEFEGRKKETRIGKGMGETGTEQ